MKRKCVSLHTIRDNFIIMSSLPNLRLTLFLQYEQTSFPPIKTVISFQSDSKLIFWRKKHEERKRVNFIVSQNSKYLFNLQLHCRITKDKSRLTTSLFIFVTRARTCDGISLSTEIQNTIIFIGKGCLCYPIKD